MSNKFAFTILLILLNTTWINCQGPFTLIRDLIQFNVAGHPILHKSVEWPFDPYLGERRSKDYQALNGYLGEKAIERLGLGIDGHAEERLAQQRLRDRGHLNGIDYLTP